MQIPTTVMTRSRIFTSGTPDEPVILSDSEEELEVSQELTLKEGATIMNPSLPPPDPLLLLLMAYLAWSLELD